MNPDFLVIGAQKCATSWLDHHLGRHRQIMLPEEKDVEFFSYTVNLNPEFHKAWLERFDSASPGMRIGDVNAAYFWTETGSQWSAREESFNRYIPESVLSYLGDEIQLIISLRNPVDRTVSAYLHHICHGPVTPDQKLMETDLALGIVDMGFFGAHLENWLRVFPARQFLVITDPPFDRDSASGLMSGTLEFLGLEAFDGESNFEKRVFPGLPRLRRPDGVWVPEEHPLIASKLPLTRKVSRMTQDGTRYFRLVDDLELARLDQIFAADQARLNGLLGNDEITVLDPRS